MEEYEVQQVLDELESTNGSGTWHITLLIRPDSNLNDMRGRIRQEVSEAQNIKSDDTQQRVESSLNKISSALSSYSQTPESGLAVFASPDDVTVLDALPESVPENLYHCGKEFVTDPIREQFSVSGVYGLIIIERGEASLGVLKNGRITESYNKQSGVMGKTRAGGQSAQRFARERERQKHEFFESIADTAQSMFEGHDIDGVALGGTTHTVGEFEDYLWHNVNLIGKYPVEYANTEALEDLVEQALDQLEEAASADAIDAVSEFFKGLRDGMSEYGPEQVERALEMGAVNTLLLSTKLDSERIRELERLADQRGSEVVVFTPSFEEGERFQKLTDGVGATLRFQV